MAKRPDNDSTMELSTSQLVPDQPDHDASVWGQVVVSPDQFSPQVPKKASKPSIPDVPVASPAATPGSRAALWIFLGFILVAAVAGALIVVYA